MSRSTRSPRPAILVTSALVLVTALAAPAGAGEDDRLEQRRRDVRGQIAGAQQSVDQSSASLARATTVLERAQKSLKSAQDGLRSTRGRLVAAQALDTRRAAELKSAQRSLTRSRASLRAGRKRLEDAERQVRRTVLAELETGDPSIKALSGLLSGEDPRAFTEQISLDGAVDDARLAAMDRLEASRVLLALRNDRVRSLRDRVARERRAAAENLALRRRLQAQARQQASAVQTLVARSTAAEQTASQQRRSDLTRLDELEGERDRLSRRLRSLAQQEAVAERKQRADRKARSDRGRDERQDTQAPDTGQDTDSSTPTEPERANDQFIYPVSSYITSPYGMRFHPVLKVWKLHDGTDFRAPCGTPVRAAASGRVLERYYDSAYGNRVILTHGRIGGSSVATTYNHLQRSSVRPGQRVRQGQVIGRAGTTGLSTGCHLHLMALEDGETVNPLRWLRR